MAEVTLTVNGGIHGYVSCPVTARCGKSACAVKQVTLTDAKTGAAVPCQVAPVTGADQVELTWIIDKLAPGEERRYVCKCEDGAPKPATGGVELTQVGEQRVDVKIGGEAFTSYNFSREFARPFLHPLIGPYGKPVTRGFPMLKGVPGETQDHPHHRSFWVAWGDVNGADNWSEQPNHGRMVHQKFNALSSGPVFGQISTTNFWVDKTGQKLLEEDRDIRIYNLPASVRAVDLTVTLRATEGQVRLGDTKEGGICSIRVATSMDAKKGGQIENAYGGVNEKETWGKRAHWCDYSGPVDGNIVGIAIFDNPSNFRYPTYWHVRDYGLMTANPFGLSHFKADKTQDGSHVIPAGGTMRFTYRVYIHVGDATIGQVHDKFLNYIFPPAVKVG